jgi:hypothetical protein
LRLKPIIHKTTSLRAAARAIDLRYWKIVVAA